VKAPDAEISAELAGRGIRATKQRIEVLRLLRALDHPTVAQIHRLVTKQYKNVSKKTVYSVLEAFVNQGLATIFTEGGEPYRYEGKTEPHFHVRCRVCGNLVDLPPTGQGRLRTQDGIPEGFMVERVQLTVVGRCRRCANDR
jgi:Fe2+ or Zn2+ uptake regulation protein